MKNFAIVAVVVALCASFASAGWTYMPRSEYSDAYQVYPETVNTANAYYDYSTHDARFSTSGANDYAYSQHPYAGDSSFNKYQDAYVDSSKYGMDYGTLKVDYSQPTYKDTYSYDGNTVYNYASHANIYRWAEDTAPSTPSYQTPSYPSYSYTAPSYSYSYPSSTSDSFNDYGSYGSYGGAYKSNNYYDSASDYGSYAYNSYNTYSYNTVPVSSASDGYGTGASRYGYGNTFVSDSYNSNYDNSFNTYSSPSYSYSYSSPSYTYSPSYSSSISQYQSYAPSSSSSYSYSGYSNPGYANRYYSYWG